MKKLMVPLVAVLALSACGSKVASVSTNPQVRQREAQAEKIVQACVAKGNFITHAGRQAVLSCIAPPGQKVAFERCAQKAVASGGFLTHGQRQRTLTGVANCLVAHR